MPIYEFESSTGERIARLFSSSDCPRSVRERGKTYRKVLSFPAIIVPDSFKAGHFEKRMKATMANNEEIATRIAADPDQHAITYGDEMPREAKADLDNRIAKKLGRTRLG